EKCYLPMNALILELVQRHAGRFRCSYSISGCALEQFESWVPEVLESFRALAATGCVEFLCETSMHSLAALFDEQEFREQVAAQRARITQLCGRAPTAFRNTELVISQRIAELVEELGFDVLLGEGTEYLLEGRSAHSLWRPEGCAKLKLLLRDYKLSDDIAFRFSNRSWEEYPLPAERFARWVGELPQGEDFVGLFMDYETFGEHQWADTGIFRFMERLPDELLAQPGVRFSTPSEVAAAREVAGRIPIPRPVSWADAERDLSAWLGNPMQRAANEALWSLAPAVRKMPAAEVELRQRWRRLTTSDHLYYMCTKFFSDGDVHKYFSPYATPHDAFVAFMNVIDDLARRIETASKPAPRTRAKGRKRG
ncbi:MAG: polysaccharide deacetylase family protein, partial [Planctomycetes bacterium]|nr:polysaccharide deacetylase family protein [Planctomycetota bacterium]